MTTTEVNVITGAFSYTGKYIARRLLAMGKEIRTLTGHPDRRHVLGEQIQAFPFAFENPAALMKSLQGATTLYNTYWIRFSHGALNFDTAVRNTLTLFSAAKAAGIQRIVHVSITNPAETSRLPYFRGKAILEQELMRSGLSYAIIRPTVIFSTEDILMNNIAWLLRHFPMFPIFGSGHYQLQPIYIEDMADLVVEAGQRSNPEVFDAVGPDIFTFEQLVRLLAEKLHRRVGLIHVHQGLAFYLAKLLEPVVGDVLITRDEIAGLMADLLISQQPPTGHTHLGDWLEENAQRVGMQYASELQRHYRLR
jgi:NADH dehydrogenase